MHKNNFLLCLGWGCDFRIKENCNVNNDSHCYGGSKTTYSIPEGMDYKSDEVR